MTKPRILLTGDDGYNSSGTRLLVHWLKDTYDLTIAGTKTQQSGVGGHKHITGSGAWGETNVDGIPALWLDGSPADAMEAARVHFHNPFDCVISGINWGANISGSLFSSGTFAAAFFSINLGLTKHAIAVSWDVPPAFHFKDHSSDDDLSSYIEHPGKTAFEAITKTFQHDFWDASIININVPEKPSTVIEFSLPLPILYGFWPDIILDSSTGLFSYGKGNHAPISTSLANDVHVLARNHISITPCQATMGDTTIYQTMLKEKI
jgi:5'-nucleotidase